MPSKLCTMHAHTQSASMMRRQKQPCDGYSDSADEYFTYRPLSNLPTPPPSSRNSSVQQSPSCLDDDELLRPKYLGPAIHLVNMIPPAASVATPSVPLVQAILTRSNLPIETIALAVCILDSLDNKFALNWRLSCPLTMDDGPDVQAKRHTLAFDTTHAPAFQLHIDSVRPEIIILSALVIAVKFLNDPQEPTQHYCASWGRGIWSHEQLNATERCVMENLNYRLLPLCDEDVLADAMFDMQLAARHYPQHCRATTPQEDLSDDESMGPVKAGLVESVRMDSESVFGCGIQAPASLGS